LLSDDFAFRNICADETEIINANTRQTSDMEAALVAAFDATPQRTVNSDLAPIPLLSEGCSLMMAF
jgi:hypothetical protein